MARHGAIGQHELSLRGRSFFRGIEKVLKIKPFTDVVVLRCDQFRLGLAGCESSEAPDTDRIVRAVGVMPMAEALHCVGHGWPLLEPLMRAEAV